MAGIEYPHQQFAGGGMREPQTGRPRFDLLVTLGVPLAHQFLTRLARHMTKSLEKYPERNWELFRDQESLERAEASAFRHFMAWMAGERDEDHAAALVFNIQAAEHVRYHMEKEEEQ